MELNIKTRKIRIILFVFICIYKLILDVLYVTHISVYYAFYHFLSDFSVLWYLLSWPIVIIFSLWLIRLIKLHGTNFSVLLTFCLFLTSFLPFTAMLYGGYDFKYILSNCAYWFIWFGSLTIFSRLSKRTLIIKQKIIVKNELIIKVLATVSIIVILFVSVVYGDLRFSLNMDSAYDYRIEAAEIAAPIMLSYLYQWARIIIPLILCFLIIKKKYFIAGIFFLIQFFNFGFDGMRLTVLITAIAIVLPFIFTDRVVKHSNIYILIVLVLIALMSLSIVEHSFFNTGEIDRLITFRTFFLPILIGTWFFDFFSGNNPEFFRASFLKLLGFASPYAEYGIDYLISGLYFGEYTARANNGLIADAMANLGKIGIIFMPFAINIWLHVVDRISKHIEFPVMLLVAVYFAYCFTNNFFTIILFTNGGLIVIILLYNIDRVYARKTEIDLRLRS